MLRRFLRHRLDDRAGFLLIEVSLALIVMGLLVGMALPALKATRTYRAFAVTRQHQERVAYALAGYAVAHNVLPRPADPSLTQGDAGYGEAVALGDRRVRGAVPFQTLGIPEAWCLDGDHRPFTYVVQRLLTEPVYATKRSPPKVEGDVSLPSVPQRGAPLPIAQVGPDASDDVSVPWQPLVVRTDTGVILGDRHDFVAFALVASDPRIEASPGAVHEIKANSSSVLWVMRNVMLSFYAQNLSGYR